MTQNNKKKLMLIYLVGKELTYACSRSKLVSSNVRSLLCCFLYCMSVCMCHKTIHKPTHRRVNEYRYKPQRQLSMSKHAAGWSIYAFFGRVDLFRYVTCFVFALLTNCPFQCFFALLLSP